MKYYLNLDETFKNGAFGQSIDYTKFKFSGGEWQFKFKGSLDPNSVIVITSRIKTGDDLFLIALAKNALERKFLKRFELFIPYFPYARQDRVCVDGEALSVKVIANFINSLGFDKVTICDVHSDVTLALLNNCVNVPNIEYVRKARASIVDKVHLVFPDSGASKKYNYLISADVRIQMVQ